MKPLACLALLVLAAALPARARVGLQGDADGDGRLSLAEFKEGRHHLLMRADRDGDGKIGPAEWLAGETKIRRQLASAGYPDRDIDLGTGGYAKMDANHDGWVDGAEVDAYITQRFEALDRDHDGYLTPPEFEAGLKAGGRY